MAKDARGVEVSTNERAALEGYELALRQYQTYVGDAVATIDEVLSSHPELVLGHLFRAGVLLTFGEARFTAEAKKSVAAADAYANAANRRERGLLRAMRLLVERDWTAGCAALDQVLVDEPRDIFAAQTAHLIDFFRGDTHNLRTRITRILPAWDAGVPGYSYLLGMHAFGLEENNQYPEAMAATERALSLQPKDAWAVHAGVHVLEMTGRVDEGIDWLETRRGDWAPDNSFAFHLAWHLALFHLDRAETARVLEVYDSAIYPSPSDIALNLVDASALLWRMYLNGMSYGDRFDKIASVWESKLESEGGFYAFNDVHAMFAFAATGREAAVRRLLVAMESVANGPHCAVVRDVGIPIARAVLAFAQGRYDLVLDTLGPVRDTAIRFGGSHAQRDVLTLTLIEAALRAGQPSVARHLVSERTVSRPGSALGWRLHARSLV